MQSLECLRGVSMTPTNTLRLAAIAAAGLMFVPAANAGGGPPDAYDISETPVSISAVELNYDKGKPVLLCLDPVTAEEDGALRFCGTPSGGRTAGKNIGTVEDPNPVTVVTGLVPVPLSGFANTAVITSIDDDQYIYVGAFTDSIPANEEVDRPVSTKVGCFGVFQEGGLRVGVDTGDDMLVYTNCPEVLGQFLFEAEL